MVEINYRVVIVGILSLAAIYVALIICDHDSPTLGYSIVAVIALAMGIVLPSPKVDNKSGVLQW